jgi:hypothetical protein
VQIKKESETHTHILHTHTPGPAPPPCSCLYTHTHTLIYFSILTHTHTHLVQLLPLLRHVHHHFRTLVSVFAAVHKDEDLVALLHLLHGFVIAQLVGDLHALECLFSSDAHELLLQGHLWELCVCVCDWLEYYMSVCVVCDWVHG